LRPHKVAWQYVGSLVSYFGSVCGHSGSVYDNLGPFAVILGLIFRVFRVRPVTHRPVVNGLHITNILLETRASL
jgi:hypothetical protein